MKTLLPLLAMLLSACGTIREARMVVPAELTAGAEESFGRPGWGRSGSFQLGGQTVRYERGADRISLFGAFDYGREPLRYSLGDRSADCAARQGELRSGIVAVASKPWTLTCSWADGSRLHIGEAPVPAGPLLASQAREGEYRRGELRLQLRSVHQLEGSALTQPQAVGYELLHDGRVVGSVDLSRGTPVLRRPDPATPLGQAVTEAALALALVWEPS